MKGLPTTWKSPNYIIDAQVESKKQQMVCENEIIKGAYERLVKILEHNPEQLADLKLIFNTTGVAPVQSQAELDFIEAKMHRQAEEDFACENGMHTTLWCQPCILGICEKH